MNTNKVYYILVGSIAVAVFVTVILILRGVGGGTLQTATLEFWGVFDDRNAFEKVISDFQTQNPGIKVLYQQFSYEEYEKKLIDSLAAGTGPDIVMLHNTWLPKHGDKLKALPDKIPGQKLPLMTIQDYRTNYVDVAFNDFVFNNQIYGLPLYVDTLALFYNKDILNSAGIARPPQDWEEINADVETITRLDGNGQITQSAAAIGTARNINRSTDLLSALMIQTGVIMTDADNRTASFAGRVNNIPAGESALRYYTDFANPSVRTYTWNDAQHYSIDAFIEGKTAMMFNYAYEVGVLKNKSPRLNFGVAPMPQVSSTDVRNYANYWGVGVPTNSKFPNESWKFMAYLTSKEGAQSYLSASLRPSARRDLIDLQRSDLDLGTFAVQALSARSWYQIDNSAIETIFADMVDDVNFGRSSVKESLENAESRVNVLMQRRR
ncbi:MAG: extracellular solute-binding protein [Candidatus Yanofskybacteria bacterium GW2011_GWA1_39_13]|uniref:Extracellular solute-binding protein n=1 Tax=Yanofskybacteria sp. (strain GW2011_GWA1_39_13) TaxID=1619019 RepID=A0A0G0MQ38_YANXG|nr:MAG: extracellular solute-binding protein [Candidatus Yanofskybacteria bacterium GW2011_GWA1_39_13]